MRTLQILAFALLFAPSQLWATPFNVTYTFTGSPGNQVSEAVDANPIGALFSDLTRGPGIVPAAGVDSMNSSGWTTGSSLDPNDYYEWTITPLAGFALDLTEFDINFQRSETGPRSVDLRNSLDGFGAFRFLVTVGDDTANHGAGVGPSVVGIWDVDDITAPVTFRIYGYDAEGASGELRLGVKAGEEADFLPSELFMTVDITEAATEVPEPASLVLFGTGVAGLIAKRRHSSRNDVIASERTSTPAKN
jgi:PEP-CTERM motif